MQIRLAKYSDAGDILRWRNDTETRAMSRNGDLIEKSVHESWFDRVLKDPNRVLLIGTVEEKSIGMVRLDMQDQPANWEVSIMLAPEARAKGLGKVLLNSALSHFCLGRPGVVLLAEIKVQNYASQRLFESLGFVQKSNDGVILHYVFEPVGKLID